MFRGNPPDGMLYKMTCDDVFLSATKSTIVSFDNVTLCLADDRPCMYKNVKLHAFTSAGSKKVAKWFKMSRPSGSSASASEISYNVTQSYTFDTGIANNIRFEVTNKEGFACFGIERVIGNGSYTFLNQVEGPESREGGTFQTKVQLSRQVSVDVKGRFSTPKLGSALLFVYTGEYENAIVPENIQSLWGPVAIDKLQPGADKKCQVADHRYTLLLIHF